MDVIVSSYIQDETNIRLLDPFNTNETKHQTNNRTNL